MRRRRSVYGAVIRLPPPEDWIGVAWLRAKEDSSTPWFCRLLHGKVFPAAKEARMVHEVGNSDSLRGAHRTDEPIVRVTETTTTLMDLLEDEGVTAAERNEAESLAWMLAEVYACRPEELIRAVGRQLHRGEGQAAADAHVDVVSAEAVARLMDYTDNTIESLPVPADKTIVLAVQVQHLKDCDGCRAMLDQFEVFRHLPDEASQIEEYGS